ncbi:hypothetical protein ACIPSA_04650 [Streptomyces sp. NPDC086549]|uniref:hypothetical protein n=1 Tax=Streptomyces sp. NPDC086549 TaxID=3365752 RepID=UPI003818FD2D
MTRRHTWTVAVLLCGVVLATTGCTAASGKPRAKASAAVSASASAAPPSCESGAVRWSSVRREVRLTEVSPVVQVRKSDGWVTFHTGLVRNVVPRVDTSGGIVSAHHVLAALAKHLKWGDDAEGLAAPGEESADRELHPMKIDSLGHTGRLVVAEGIHVVDASFTVDCPGRDVYGSVTTWFGNSRASLACGVDPGDEAWVREAYRLTCGRLSR